MEFGENEGENLFEDLASDRKEKQIQYPYSVRQQDIFVSRKIGIVKKYRSQDIEKVFLYSNSQNYMLQI